MSRRFLYSLTDGILVMDLEAGRMPYSDEELEQLVQDANERAQCVE